MTRISKPVLMAFVVGGVVGVAGARWCAPFAFHRHWQETPARMLERFSSKLHLTPTQRTQVAAILEAKRKKIEALRAEVRPKFDQIRTATSAEIRPLLRPEQQKKFDVMQAEWETRRKQWRGGA